MIPLAVCSTCVIAAFILVALVGMWTPSAIMSRDALVKAGEDQLKTNVATVAPQIGKLMQSASEHATIIETLWNISLARSPRQPVNYMFDAYQETLWSIVHNNAQYGAFQIQSRANRDVLNETGRINCMPLHDSDIFWIADLVVSSHWNNQSIIANEHYWLDPLRSIRPVKSSFPCSHNGSSDVAYHEVPTWEDVTVHSDVINASFRNLIWPVRDPPHTHKSSMIVASLILSIDSNIEFVDFETAADVLQAVRGNSELNEWYVLIDRNGTLVASSDPEQKVQIYSDSGVLVGMTSVNNESAVLEPTLTVGKHIMSKLCDEHCNVTGLYLFCSEET